MKAGVQVEVARMLFRIIGFLLQPGSPRALQMRAYALAYASRMGEYSQLFSLRDTARKCAVSVEALRKCAWYWVEQLGLPPLEGAKSQAAKTKYAANGLDNHWRHQKCKNPTTTPSK